MIPRVTRTAELTTRSKPDNTVLSSNSSKTVKADVDVLIKEQSAVSDLVQADFPASQSQQFVKKALISSVNPDDS